MKFSTRLNSFKTKKEIFFKDYDSKSLTVVDYISRMATVKGLTHVELNYPEHFVGVTVEEIQNVLAKTNLKISGVALRFVDSYAYGEFANPDESIREQAIATTMEAVKLCNDLGGEVTTIWLANDGFDYPFQLDYEKAFNKVVDALKRITQRFPDSKISFEYKPYQPRAFSLIGDISTTLLLIEEVGAPNLGVTLDFCHMLMRKENPAYSLALAARKNRVMGFHLNDGYKDNDDGLMLGSVHLMQTLEFIYYAKKYNYDGLIYFDTFPIREDPVKECEQNIEMYKVLDAFLEKYGLERIEKIIQNENALEAQQLLLSLIKDKMDLLATSII
ncbi:sugar phosphate isomerase/epimerase [Neobacillus cucumis]|uniref:sugar phosphate isomerase/epimerase family protein n=1 Tax=Neobacillus cucumis TaxID=1740721 RepID=UPI00203D1109|nr:sugar phosphate isomerase/epimerase family protein [Neobacillus cucumis]MCM3728936.1 sugar phosphate isomerase/epimerase [Neobacillus cucumis]